MAAGQRDPQQRQADQHGRQRDERQQKGFNARHKTRIRNQSTECRLIRNARMQGTRNPEERGVLLHAAVTRGERNAADGYLSTAG
jgi:hypothetical protein